MLSQIVLKALYYYHKQEHLKQVKRNNSVQHLSRDIEKNSLQYCRIFNQPLIEPPSRRWKEECERWRQELCSASSGLCGGRRTSLPERLQQQWQPTMRQRQPSAGSRPWLDSSLEGPPGLLRDLPLVVPPSRARKEACERRRQELREQASSLRRSPCLLAREAKQRQWPTGRQRQQGVRSRPWLDKRGGGLPGLQKDVKICQEAGAPRASQASVEVAASPSQRGCGSGSGRPGGSGSKASGAGPGWTSAEEVYQDCRKMSKYVKRQELREQARPLRRSPRLLAREAVAAAARRRAQALAGQARRRSTRIAERCVANKRICIKHYCNFCGNCKLKSLSYLAYMYST